MNEATFLEAAKAFVPYGARIVSLGFSPELLGVHFAGHYSISFTDSFETFLWTGSVSNESSSRCEVIPSPPNVAVIFM